ncbi:MAG: tRNA (adenosine(37)-N6)-threonylcarbamoyltransferase complex ATPase subunit type 1 TsaE [Bacteroidales bacterium]|nr:tRNA (adenosine(37)-N6)-threonylcarbamoyltransferase complex ATPase subunit type 1 TsaE [Bacteroidales bacterium]
MEILCPTPNDFESIAKGLLSAYPQQRVFAFFGKMGVGKTTFIKALCKVLGSVDVVNSPTFSIINEYITNSGESIYHFDFYRLKSREEAIDIGVEDYLYSGNYCFIEWPDIFTGLLPEHYVSVTIEADENTLVRKIVF